MPRMKTTVYRFITTKRYSQSMKLDTTHITYILHMEIQHATWKNACTVITPDWTCGNGCFKIQGFQLIKSPSTPRWSKSSNLRSISSHMFSCNCIIFCTITVPCPVLIWTRCSFLVCFPASELYRCTRCNFAIPHLCLEPTKVIAFHFHPILRGLYEQPATWQP